MKRRRIQHKGWWAYTSEKQYPKVTGWSIKTGRRHITNWQRRKHHNRWSQRRRMKHKGWWANTSDKQYPIRSKRNSGNRSIKWRGRRTRNTLRQLQEWTRKVIQQTRRQQSKLGEWRKTKQQQKRTRRAYITLRDNNIFQKWTQVSDKRQKWKRNLWAKPQKILQLR